GAVVQIDLSHRFISISPSVQKTDIPIIYYKASAVAFQQIRAKSGEFSRSFRQVFPFALVLSFYDGRFFAVQTVPFRAAIRKKG
ncbi:MAG: hypothetical protein IJM93_03135, partial [Oscillospiraceae bacterium]|nr:hypothetical protein [Oscillospiraceae bacterium]